MSVQKVLNRKSNGGCSLVMRSTFNDAWLVRSQSSALAKIVCSTSVALPPCPTAKWYLPALDCAGNEPQTGRPKKCSIYCGIAISAAASTAARCWRSNPARSRRHESCPLKGNSVTSERPQRRAQYLPAHRQEIHNFNHRRSLCVHTLPVRRARTVTFLLSSLDADYLVQGVTISTGRLSASRRR